MRVWKVTSMTARKMNRYTGVYKLEVRQTSDDGLEQTSTSYCMVSRLLELGFKPVGKKMVWSCES